MAPATKRRFSHPQALKTKKNARKRIKKRKEMGDITVQTFKMSARGKNRTMEIGQITKRTRQETAREPSRHTPYSQPHIRVTH